MGRCFIFQLLIGVRCECEVAVDFKKGAEDNNNRKGYAYVITERSLSFHPENQVMICWLNIK